MITTGRAVLALRWAVGKGRGAGAHTREVRAPCVDIGTLSKESDWILHPINFTAFITKNYTRPHSMKQACTPYKTPATRHHTQSTHQSAEAHTTSITRDQLLSLVSGLSLTQTKAQAHDLSPQALQRRLH